MKILSLLVLVLAAAVVGYPVNAADLPPLYEFNPSGHRQARLRTRLLGLVLVDPTGQEMEQHQMESPLPLVVQLEEPAFFPKGTAPTQGCAFWIVEPPANGYLFKNQHNAGTRFPKTVRELVQAIIACTASPEEYEKLRERVSQTAREYAESLQDEPEKRERFLRIANSKIPPDEVGKYICRVVYNYPGRRGTMTTYIRMTKEDLEQLRARLKQ